jgi:hypothetical protein
VKRRQRSKQCGHDPRNMCGPQSGKTQEDPWGTFRGRQLCWRIDAGLPAASTVREIPIVTTPLHSPQFSQPHSTEEETEVREVGAGPGKVSCFCSRMAVVSSHNRLHYP